MPSPVTKAEVFTEANAATEPGRPTGPAGDPAGWHEMVLARKEHP